MNVERLRAFAEMLLQWEDELHIQDRLAELNNALSAMSSAIQDAGRQVEVGNKLSSLSKTISQLDLDAAETKMLASIGASRFFSSELIAKIQELIAANPMTPAIVQQYVGKHLKQRNAYLQHLRTLKDTLAAIGIEAEELEEGSAEIGFQIPRDLFHNNLEGLIKELGAIKRIIRAFSEVNVGTAEPIEVRQISTSDPLFLFGLDPRTIVALGAAVTWALSTWHKVEAIRKTRAETRKIGSFTEEEIESFFGSKIKQTIEKEIEGRVTELVGRRDGRAGRKEEQRTDIQWALKSILARIERGMTVEVRFLPPPEPKDAAAETSDGEATKEHAFEELSEIKQQLVFPPREEIPILQLPPSEPKSTTDGKPKS